jgi:hypothetical protein
MELTSITLFGYPVITTIIKWWIILGIILFVIFSAFTIIEDWINSWQDYKQRIKEEKLSEKDKNMKESIEHVARTWND